MKKLILMLTLVALMGCGSKKVLTTIDKSSTKQKSDITDKSKTEESQNTQTDTKVSSKEDKQEKSGSSTGLSFTSDKPVKITEGGRSYEFTPNGAVNLNISNYYQNRLQLIKDSISRVIDSLDKKIENDRKEISSLEQKLYSKDKNTEKEGNVRPWAAFGAAAFLVIGFFLYKYFTNPKRLTKKPA